MEKIKHVQEILIDRIDPFPEHPYIAADNDDMENLMESIRAKGVLVPCILRELPHERYDMISGHRRMRARKRLGPEPLPGIVMDLSKDEAGSDENADLPDERESKKGEKLPRQTCSSTACGSRLSFGWRLRDGGGGNRKDWKCGIEEEKTLVNYNSLKFYLLRIWPHNS